MKIIITCDQQHFEAAADIAAGQMPGWRTTYDRVGWGWSQRHASGIGFFVKRITDGLSVTQVSPKPGDLA